MESYQSKHKGQTIDNVVDKVLQNEAGLQGVKVDNVELAPDIENKVNIDLNSKLENYATFSDVPTKTSQLTNDSDFATTSSLPTTTSQLTNDSGFITSDELPAIPTVVQAKGSSTTDVISQNVVTQELNSLETKINTQLIDNKLLNFTNWDLTPISNNLASYQVMTHDSSFNAWARMALEFDPVTRIICLNCKYITNTDKTEKRIKHIFSGSNLRNVSDNPEFLICNNSQYYFIIDKKDNKVYRGWIDAFGTINGGVTHISTLPINISYHTRDRYIACFVNNLLYLMCEYCSSGSEDLYVSSDFGQTWKRANSYGDVRFIRYINNEYYIGAYDHNYYTYKSTNGINFSIINSSGLDLQDIAYDSTKNKWYAKTSDKFYSGSSLSQLNEVPNFVMTGEKMCRCSQSNPLGVIGLNPFYENRVVYETKDFVTSKPSEQAFPIYNGAVYFNTYYPVEPSSVNKNLTSIVKINGNHYIAELRDYNGEPNPQKKIPVEYLSKTIPTKTSELTNDSGFVTSSSIPQIPTKTSELTNDSGFVTTSELPEPIEISTETGNSDTKAISQNAVTSEFNIINNKMYMVDTKLKEVSDTSKNFVLDTKLLNFTNWKLTPITVDLASYQTTRVDKPNYGDYKNYEKLVLETDITTHNVYLATYSPQPRSEIEGKLSLYLPTLKNEGFEPEFLLYADRTKYIIIDSKDGKVYSGEVYDYSTTSSNVEHIGTYPTPINPSYLRYYKLVCVNGLLYVYKSYNDGNTFKLYVSNDYGVTWTDTGIQTYYVNFIRYLNGKYYLGHGFNDVICSSSDGITFTEITASNPNITDLAYDSSARRWYGVYNKELYYGFGISDMRLVTDSKMSGHILARCSKTNSSSLIGLWSYPNTDENIYVMDGNGFHPKNSYQCLPKLGGYDFEMYHPVEVSEINSNITAIIKLNLKYYLAELKNYDGKVNPQIQIPVECLTEKIPKKLSELSNDKNFVTNTQVSKDILASTDNSKNIICNSNLLNFTNWNLHPINDRPASMQVCAYDKVRDYANRSKLFLTFDTDTKAVKINTLYSQTVYNYLSSNTMRDFPTNNSYDPEFWFYTNNDKYIIIHGTDGKVYSGNTGVNGISSSPTQIGTYPETISYAGYIKRYKLVCVNGLLYVYFTYGSSENNTLYVSNDYGATWTNTGFNYTNISFLRYINGAYYLREGYFQRLYTSTDGITFTSVSASNNNITDVTYDSVNNKWYGLYNQELYSGTSIGNMTKISGSKMSGTILARYSKTNPLAVIGLWGEEEYYRAYKTIYSTDNFVNIKDSYQAFKQLGADGFGMYHPFEVSETNANIVALVKLYSKYYIAELINYSEKLTPQVNIPPEMCLPTTPTSGTYSLKVVNGKIQWVSG